MITKIANYKSIDMTKGVYKHKPQQGFQVGHKGFRDRYSYEFQSLILRNRCRTDETKRKIGLASKSRWQDPSSLLNIKNHRDRLRNLRKGQKSHRKGVTWEEEYGVIKANEIREKQRNARKGKHYSPITEFKEGVPPPTHREGCCCFRCTRIPWNKDKKGLYKQPQETIEKRRKSQKKAWHKMKIEAPERWEERNKKISESLKLFYKTIEGEKKRRTNTPMKGEKHTQRSREKIKTARAKQIFPLKDTKIEKKIQFFLELLEIPFFTHHYISEITHSYQCDIFIPSMNMVIECDGDYWHKYPVGNKIDNIRVKELVEKGFKVLRLWERDIKIMDISDFERRLKACY